ncbi:Uncharacterized membrane protein [Allopseudospirillum japonicum]|uniref:Uncharacterized membrane protein n=1 Tax=Allopseudospirillum japonicum TaxID=64971 RepID=A0A1H6SHC9_9GAMM|nr:hypothetical protein [Allopseudospirillum japonicum]SEI64257.1 Uncharacterized membrane protein [Allopseudospirillum japonicum]
MTQEHQVYLVREKEEKDSTAKIIYILYIASLVFGITSLVGVILAYVNRSEASEWLACHYRYQIRTFWIGLVYVTIGGALTYVGIGYFILLFWIIWLIVRCAKGLRALGKKQAPQGLTSWWM